LFRPQFDEAAFDSRHAGVERMITRAPQRKRSSSRSHERASGTDLADDLLSMAETIDRARWG
jgi:hypothetical protein